MKRDPNFAYNNKVEPYAIKVTGLTAVTLTTIINVTAPNTYYDIIDENNFMYRDYLETNGIQVSGYFWFLTYLKIYYKFNVMWARIVV